MGLLAGGCLCGLGSFGAGLRASVALSIGVAAVHTAAMLVAGGVVAFGVYRWLGLRILPKIWLNLDVLWALSLMLVGAIGVAAAL